MILVNLRSLIENSGKSQREIARDLSISQQRFNYYINGKREPDFDTLSSIADYFDVTVDYLLGRTPQEEKKPAANNDDELHMITRSLNPSGHAELIRYARYLASQPEYTLPPARRA
jgi:transcriptional regulator with XRE-family HTH domain